MVYAWPMRRSTRAGVEDRWTTRTGSRSARYGQGRPWLARWVDHDGNERSKAFDRKVDAQHHIAEITTALTSGSYADPKRAAVTFETVADDWFASKASLKPKTVAGYRSLLDVVVLANWGDVRLGDIKHADIQAWVNRLSTDSTMRQRKAPEASGGAVGLSPARVIQAYQVVDQVLRLAVRARYITGNPADHVQLPRKNAREKFALTHQQVHQLAQAAGELGTMVYTLAYGGLRYGECAALRIRDVDLGRRRLRVSRSVTAVAGMGMVEGSTKTHQARLVPLPQVVIDQLVQRVEASSPDDLVFPHHDGSWIPRDWFAWRFDKACAAAGLKDVTPHTLRHTAGSLALASGASVVTVQKLLGHQSPITTMNVYAHQLPDDFDNLAAAMDSAAQAAALVATV